VARNGANTAQKVKPLSGELTAGVILEGPQLSDAEFFSFCQLVHQHAGIHLTPQKKELVRGRLMKILRQRGISSFRDYYQKVLQDQSGLELVHLLDAISTNQTSFWREPGHFEYLAREILPTWRSRGPVQRTIWSAGCSSGEEPYTLAMVCLDVLEDQDLSRLKILASDINTQVLEQARRGVYPFSRVEPLPEDYRRRFCQRGVGKCEGLVRVKPEVRQFVEFFRLNLMDPLPFGEELDLIFCRNVMIYFSKQTQAELVKKFYRCLKPGGYLFIGHSESLCGHQNGFHYLRPTIYRK